MIIFKKKNIEILTLFNLKLKIFIQIISVKNIIKAVILAEKGLRYKAHKKPCL